MPKFTFISAVKATMSQNDNAYWTQYRGGGVKKLTCEQIKYQLFSVFLFSGNSCWQYNPQSFSSGAKSTKSKLGTEDHSNNHDHFIDIIHDNLCIPAKNKKILLEQHFTSNMPLTDSN